MQMFRLVTNSIFLGAGLAVDAFSAALANGLQEPGMRGRKIFQIAGTFALFQAVMPLIGWCLVHTVLHYVSAARFFIPWMALLLLGAIGGKMLQEGLRGGTKGKPAIGWTGLILQGFATSIDALSVGTAIAEYAWGEAAACAVTIAAVTFLFCTAGVLIGGKFGRKLSGKAEICGGILLLFLGLEIFITGIR